MIIIGKNASHSIFTQFLFLFFIFILLDSILFILFFYIVFIYSYLISSPYLLVNFRLFRDATDMRQDVATLLLLVQVETVNAPDEVMKTLLKAKNVQVKCCAIFLFFLFNFLVQFKFVSYIEFFTMNERKCITAFIYLKILPFYYFFY